MDKAATLLSDFLNAHGVCLPVLGRAMESFTESVFPLPEEAACATGCGWCCHLRVVVSIPELLVIHDELTAQTTPEGMVYFESKMREADRAGDLLDEQFWYESQTPCPFLDGRNACLIYPIRPFACRAHHSTDASVCQKGYEEKRQMMVPCFPLYRASTDMYASVLIRALADRGFASYQVGFVKGLAMLMADPDLTEAWLGGADVFSPARIRDRH